MFGVVAMKMREQKHGEVEVFERLVYDTCSATEAGKPVPLPSVVRFD